MKALFCIDHLRADGTQRVLCHLTAGLVERGHRVAVLCLNDSWDAGVIEQLRRSGAIIRVVGKAGLVGGYGLAGILQWMRRQNFEVIVTCSFGPTFSVASWRVEQAFHGSYRQSARAMSTTPPGSSSWCERQCLWPTSWW
jgi:hypothetical protein